MDKSLMPFGKNDHIRFIKEVAIGLKAAKKLNRYLEMGLRAGDCFKEIAALAIEAWGIECAGKHMQTVRQLHIENAQLFEMKTIDFFNKVVPNLNDVKWDLVFIDANHRHEHSWEDFKNIFPHVSDNGIILMHDAYPTMPEICDENGYCSDSYKTAWKIRTEMRRECEIMTMPFYFGIACIRKANRQLMWRP